MKKLRDSLGGMVMSICELLTGILLLIDPADFTTIIIVGFGWLMLISGVLNVTGYFRTPPEAAAKEQLLAKGLGVIALGLFCIFRSGWFIAAFPLLTLLYAVAILAMGLVKIQRTVDAVRLKKPGWHWRAIGAVASVAFAAVIIINPFSSAVYLWIFTGISLIAGAVLDFITLVFAGKTRNA